MKDKGFKICFVIYIIMFLADLITTLRTGEVMQYLEANPLFHLGGLAPIVLFNILIIIVYYFLYQKVSPDMRFYVMFSMVLIILTRVSVVYSNYLVGSNPPTIEQAMAVTQTMKNEAMISITKTNIMPMFTTLFTWLFFRKDHNIEVKNETNIRNKTKENKEIIKETTGKVE